MKIVYHLGAHCTDEERLLRCLLKNRGELARRGVSVPGPTRYRNLLRDTAIALKGQPASAETEAMVLDQINEEEGAGRLILSWDNFLAFLPWAVEGALYPAAGPRTRAFAQIFPGAEVEFHLALRNPASFLPEVFHRQKAIKGGKAEAQAFLAGLESDAHLWSDLVTRIQEANPGAAVTLWCDEDAPLIWPEVLQALAGQGPDLALEDADALLAELLPPETLAGLRPRLAGVDPATRRHLISEALQTAPLTQEVEMEGWTEATVARLTATYAEDCAHLARMAGVRMIRP